MKIADVPRARYLVEQRRIIIDLLTRTSNKYVVVEAIGERGSL